MALEVQQSTQYRTPSIREAYIGENVAVEHLARSQEIQRLTTQCLYPFTTSVPQVQGEPAGDNKMKVHKDGQKPYNPTDGTHRDAFFNEAFTLVATYCQDFLMEKVI